MTRPWTIPGLYPHVGQNTRDGGGGGGSATNPCCVMMHLYYCGRENLFRPAPSCLGFVTHGLAPAGALRSTRRIATRTSGLCMPLDMGRSGMKRQVGYVLFMSLALSRPFVSSPTIVPTSVPSLWTRIVKFDPHTSSHILTHPNHVQRLSLSKGQTSSVTGRPPTASRSSTRRGGEGWIETPPRRSSCTSAISGRTQSEEAIM